LKKILYIVNTDWFFVSHRMPIAIEALKQGYEVHIATTVNSKKDILEKHGFTVHNIKINRGSNGIGMLKEFYNIFLVIKKIKPEILHLVTIKPVIFGGIVARFLKIQGVVFAISGLGIVFQINSHLMNIRYKLIVMLYKFILGHRNQITIFQNNEDLRKLSLISKHLDKNSVLLPGSGVDLKLFRPTKTELKNPLIMMASRLLISKGVLDFVNAAELFQTNYNIKARFVLIGDIDEENPDSISYEQRLKLEKNKYIEFWGKMRNMQEIIPQASIVVFPSYYGEGLPKILIEASACGKAVITTNHPGCRDAISAESGILVPIKSPVLLSKSIKYLVSNPSKLVKMGIAGRALAESKYSIENICQQHIKIYKKLQKTI